MARQPIPGDFLILISRSLPSLTLIFLPRETLLVLLVFLGWSFRLVGAGSGLLVLVALRIRCGRDRKAEAKRNSSSNAGVHDLHEHGRSSDRSEIGRPE